MIIKEPISSKVFDVLVCCVIGVIGICLGYIEGGEEVRREAVRLKHAERVVVWDGTNNPTISFRWITNQPISEKPALGNR